MAKYWFCVTNKENWRVIKSKNVWGVSERRRRQLESVEPGDFLTFYVKPLKVGGVFVADSKPFISTEKIFATVGFPAEETFPHRVRLKPILVPENPIEFRPLIPRLRSITNKKMWTGHIRAAMRTIPEEDYEALRSSLEKT